MPWIQVGAKQYSTRLLLDIVSMKLPASALIFLANLDVDFTVNFLGRCRMNAVDGDQVNVYKTSRCDVIYLLVTVQLKSRILLDSLKNCKKLFFPSCG